MSDINLSTKITDSELSKMDKAADKVIKTWTFGTLIGNLLPPPFDTIIVGTAFARMGVKIGKAYNINLSVKKLKHIGKSIAKGIGSVAFASYVGSGVFKWIPGINIWVALLIQPPIVAAITYSVGHAFKEYYHYKLIGYEELTAEQLTKMATNAFEKKLNT